MKRQVIWLQDALDDLFKLFDWIAEACGDEIALKYIKQLGARVSSLEISSDRGTPRSEIVPALRYFYFRKRTMLFYRVAQRQVEIVRVVHGGAVVRLPNGTRRVEVLFETNDP